MREQYRSRKTLRGRVVMGIVWLVVLCSQIIPWSPVFAIQERLSPEPGAAGGISMTWPTHADVTTSSGGQSLSSSGVKAPVGSTNEEARLVLPLSVTGMPANTILKLDKAAVTLFDASGMSLFHGDGGDVEIRQERVAIGPITYYETVKLPAQTYQVNKGRTVRAGTTYSMTLFKLKTSYAIPALGGDQLMPGWGRCVTRMNGASTAIEMTCMQMGKGPTCATVFLEDPLEGARNQMNRSCNPNYSPYAGRPIPDAVAHFRLILPFRDIAGLTKFAVDGSRLDRARIVIRVYEPQDHFTREVTSPLVMMQDLETQ